MPELRRRPRGKPMPEQTSLVSHGLSLIKSKYDSDVSNVIIDIGLLTQKDKTIPYYNKDAMLMVLQYKEEWRTVYEVFRAAPNKDGKPVRETMKKFFEAEVTASSITPILFKRGVWEAELEQLSKLELKDGEENSGGEKPKRKYNRRKTTKSEEGTS